VNVLGKPYERKEGRKEGTFMRCVYFWDTHDIIPLLIILYYIILYLEDPSGFGECGVEVIELWNLRMETFT